MSKVYEFESTGKILVSQEAFENIDMVILHPASTELYGVVSTVGRVTTFGGAGNVLLQCDDDVNHLLPFK